MRVGYGVFGSDIRKRIEFLAPTTKSGTNIVYFSPVKMSCVPGRAQASSLGGPVLMGRSR